MKVDLSILIINWNTRDILSDCLKSLTEIDRDLLGFPIEIIVVDNASSDSSVETVKRDFPEVEIIENRTNLGFGLAVNQAAEKASGSYYLISNADIVYTADAVKGMLSCLKSKNNIAVSAPKLVDKDGLKQPSSFRFPALSRLAVEQLLTIGNFGEISPDSSPIFHAKSQNVDFDELKREDIRFLEVDWVLGATFMIKSYVFHDLSGFYGGYFMYSEETDLFYRIKKKGGKIFFLPDISVIHISRASSSQNYKKMLLQQTLSLVLFFTRNHGKLEGKTARVLILIGQTLRYCIFKIMSLIFRSHPDYKIRADVYRYLLQGILSEKKQNYRVE